jgi:hypothetical protein
MARKITIVVFVTCTMLSLNADIDVWHEPAVSILISTLKMVAKFYSETSVTTKQHGITTQKSTL